MKKKIIYIFLIFMLETNLFANIFKTSISSSPNRINPLLATDSASSEIANVDF